MHAATPQRGCWNPKQQHHHQHGTAGCRQPPTKSQTLPFSSSSSRKGAHSQPGRTGSIAQSRPNFTFSASPRSLALGPPRSDRSRGSDRMPPARSPPPSLPFSDRSRARQLSPQAMCRSPQRSNPASVRMSAHSPPPVPQFCGSTNVLPGSNQHNANRGSLYPMPGVSRFTSFMPPRDSSVKPRQDVLQPAVDNLSRTISGYRSPTRSQSVGPSMHSFVAPPLSSFVPPVVPPVNIGSFVGPPLSPSYVAPPPNTPAPGRNCFAAPTSQTLSSASPDPATTTSRSFRARSPSPDRLIMAPPLPYTLQVGSVDRCFMASVPSLSVRGKSPTAVVATPALPKSNLSRGSPGPSYVSPPPLPSQNSLIRSTSMDHCRAPVSK